MEISNCYVENIRSEFILFPQPHKNNICGFKIDLPSPIMEYILAFSGGVVIGVLIEHLFFKKNPANDDPDGKIKQAISDSLTKIKADIQSTI